MLKGDVRDIINKVFMIFLGIMTGFIANSAYHDYPDGRMLIYIFISVMIIIAIFITEKIKYKNYFSNTIKEIIKKINNNEHIEPIGSDSENIILNELFETINTHREACTRRIEMQQSVLDMENMVADNIDLDSLIDNILPQIVKNTKSNWGVFYNFNKYTGKLELKKSIGLSKNIYKEFDVEIGEGFLGIAALNREIQVFNDIPEDTAFEYRSFLGKIKPKNIMTIPIFNKDELMAVLAVASIYSYDHIQIEILEFIKNYLGFALENRITYEKSQRLSKELQFQNELIQNMNDELENKVVERTVFLNSIIDSVKDYIIIAYDKDGYISTWNYAAERFYGIRSENVIGKHLSAVFIEKEQLNIITEIQEKAILDGEYYSFDWKTNKDGVTFYAETIVKVVINSLGEPTGFTYMVKDITEIKELEHKFLYEQSYNSTLAEKTIFPLIFVNNECIILNANTASRRMLVNDSRDIIGKKFYEFFENTEEIKRKLENIINNSGNGEFQGELLYKNGDYNGVNSITTKVFSTDDNIGAVIRFMSVSE